MEGMKGYGNMTRNLVNLNTIGERTDILTFYGHFCLLSSRVWIIVYIYVGLTTERAYINTFCYHPWLEIILNILSFC